MVSLLIVNWNTRDLLRSCLQSIKKFAPNLEYEVIVVDNASGDGSAEMVRREFSDVILINPKVNTGYAAGNNLGFEAARGDVLVTLNPDTELCSGTIENALEALTSDFSVGVVGIKQIGRDGKTQNSVRGFPSFWGIFGELTGLSKFFPNGRLGSYRLPRFDYEIEGPAPQPMGTFLMFKREALMAVGDPKEPFDNHFPIFFNEVDLLFRLEKAGWRCLYTPKAQILHHGGESTKQVKKSMIWESHRSLIRYFNKHHGTGISRIGLPFLAGVIYTAAWIRAKGHDVGFRP